MQDLANPNCNKVEHLWKESIILFLILLGKLGNPSQKIALANIYPSKIIFNFNSDLNIYAIDDMI